MPEILAYYGIGLALLNLLTIGLFIGIKLKK